MLPGTTVCSKIRRLQNHQRRSFWLSEAARNVWPTTWADTEDTEIRKRVLIRSRVGCHARAMERSWDSRLSLGNIARRGCGHVSMETHESASERDDTSSFSPPSINSRNCVLLGLDSSCRPHTAALPALSQLLLSRVIGTGSGLVQPGPGKKRRPTGTFGLVWPFQTIFFFNTFGYLGELGNACTPVSVTCKSFPSPSNSSPPSVLG